MDNTIVMISAGMKKPKKDYNPLNGLNLYLNYGLLGLGTVLSDRGYKVKVFQGDYKSIEELLYEINSCSINLTSLKYPIFISMPSFFALSWTKEFVHSIKAINNEIKIVVGGRWVVDNNVEWLKIKLSHIDLFVKGFGEKYIEKCLNQSNWGSLNDGITQNVEVFNKLNYIHLFNYKKYQPCIEVSRGCGRGCKFCVESSIKAIDNKEPKKIIQEAKDTSRLYGCDALNFYFQASIFNPTIEWANEFCRIYQEENMKFQWRFETRVDTINKVTLPSLSRAGLKVIDLGLESASADQLLNMKKTKNVVEYLDKATEILEEAYKNNIWIKLNILLYPGETVATINETLQWLRKNKKNIKGVSVNPLILYRNGDSTYDFINHIESLSEIKVDTYNLEEKGYLFPELSKGINTEYLKKKALCISRSFMGMQDYYDLKSICYYSRNIKFNDFKKTINKAKYRLEDLPFSLIEEE